MREDRGDTGRESGPSSASHVAHGVPGGSVRLPRLNGRTFDEHVVLDGDTHAPPVEVIDGGFVHDEVTRARRTREERRNRDEGSDPEPVHMSFSDYSPTESLFVHGAATSERDPDTGEVRVLSVEDDELTRVLGVDPDADWNTIRAAHRTLLAQLHPDRFVMADEQAQSDAAERLAAINVAYHELEKVRRAV